MSQDIEEKKDEPETYKEFLKTFEEQLTSAYRLLITRVKDGYEPIVELKSARDLPKRFCLFLKPDKLLTDFYYTTIDVCSFDLRKPIMENLKASKHNRALVDSEITHAMIQTILAQEDPDPSVIADIRIRFRAFWKASYIAHNLEVPKVIVSKDAEPSHYYILSKQEYGTYDAHGQQIPIPFSRRADLDYYQYIQEYQPKEIKKERKIIFESDQIEQTYLANLRIEENLKTITDYDEDQADMYAQAYGYESEGPLTMHEIIHEPY